MKLAPTIAPADLVTTVSVDDNRRMLDAQAKQHRCSGAVVRQQAALKREEAKLAELQADLADANQEAAETLADIRVKYGIDGGWDRVTRRIVRKPPEAVK